MVYSLIESDHRYFPTVLIADASIVFPNYMKNHIVVGIILLMLMMIALALLAMATIVMFQIIRTKVGKKS